MKNLNEQCQNGSEAFLVFAFTCVIFACQNNTNPLWDDQANRAFDSGDFENAIVHSSSAILEDSTYMDMYALRARSYIEIGNCRDAIKDVRKVYQLSGQVGFLTYAGYCMNELGKYEEALQVYDSILHIDSDIYDAYKGRARAYAFLDNMDSARVNYLRYIAYDSLDYRAWNSLGIVYSDLQQIDSAEYAYVRALNLNTMDWMAHYNLSILHAERGDLARALSYNSTAMKLADEYVELLSRERGKLFHELRVFDSACYYWNVAKDEESVELMRTYCAQ